MSISEEGDPAIKSVLIITSSGGGGLLQAANAKEQEIRSKYPGVKIIQRDVMKDWMWGIIGRWFVKVWNQAQHRGDVRVQSFFGFAAPLADCFFWPYIFFGSLYTIFKSDADRVLDTQVMGTSAVIKALRIFNRKRKKEVKLEKILVDMPTRKATHFFTPIKRLSAADRRLLKIITIAPLLEKGETEADFWLKYCNVNATHLQYENFYVRQAFRSLQNKDKKRGKTILRTLYKNQEELELIQKAIARSSISPKIGNGALEFTIAPSDRVFTVLLGSQPAKESTLNYVKNWISLARESRTPAYLFVFCADHTPGTNSLFKQVSDYVSNIEGYPSHFVIVPMSFQNDEVIAPLFHRSDITCTRSGGQTAMEVMCAGTGQMWIHSEAKKKKGALTNEELLAGIPGWESANAAYVQQMAGAKLVTPETFISFARQVMQGAVEEA